MSTVRVLQHAMSEPPGAIVDALCAAGLTLEIVRTFEGEEVPADPEGVAGLIAMGGPMGVYEDARYPFLRDEMRLIEKTLGAGKPVLGVCLGSQLLATVLGATVRRGERKEIGWYTVRLSEAGSRDILFSGVDSSFTAFHWHGDIFDLPHGSTGLASSDATACQAFRHSTLAYGLLFHAEVTRPMVAAMVHGFAEELAESGAHATDVLRDAERYLPPLGRVASSIFHHWTMLVAESEN